MKPFDLKEALAENKKFLLGGEWFLPLCDTSNDFLIYCKLGEDGEPNMETLTYAHTDYLYDYAKMWGDTVRVINGVEVPPCVTVDEWENGEEYYHVEFAVPEFVCRGTFDPAYLSDQRLFENGLVFQTKEGALAMAKALLNYKVEK